MTLQANRTWTPWEDSTLNMMSLVACLRHRRWEWRRATTLDLKASKPDVRELYNFLAIRSVTAHLTVVYTNVGKFPAVLSEGSNNCRKRGEVGRGAAWCIRGYYRQSTVRVAVVNTLLVTIGINHWFFNVYISLCSRSFHFPVKFLECEIWAQDINSSGSIREMMMINTCV